MCEPRILYSNDDGYVAYCGNCGYLQLAFGILLISLSGCNFNTLMDMVKAVCPGEDAGQQSNRKDIIIPTPTQEVSMILTGSEALRLLAILEKADDEMKMVQLLDLFK